MDGFFAVAFAAAPLVSGVFATEGEEDDDDALRGACLEGEEARPHFSTLNLLYSCSSHESRLAREHFSAVWFLPASKDVQICAGPGLA